ncbi:MAG: DNA-binding transcriptional regulator AsnC [Methanomassiliicoccales archaeon PtaU1.Bin124]|nr:MAG: DNA-binding transcriptional regulator AsnC [Methanomassiliicoccales archaeon PtaU1.Bin124]
MAGAIVLINTDIGKESSVLEQLKALDSVECAYLLYGVYDIAVKVRTTDMATMDEVLLTEIRGLPGVRATLTLVVSKEFRRV